MTFWYLLGYSLSKAIAKTFFRYRVIGAENIVEEGPCIFAANHASFLDPPLAGIACQRGIHYLARKSLLNWPVLGPILPELNVIPVDQANPDRSALMGCIRVVREGGGILVFPEGSRTHDGHLQPARPGIGMIVAKTGAPVVPMRIFGSYEAFPPGKSWPRATPVTVVVGPKLSFPEGGKRDAYQKIGEEIMAAIGRLEIGMKTTQPALLRTGSDSRG